MAAKALGSHRVLAVSMPCQSNLKDMEDAVAVSNKFEVEHITVDLTDSFLALKNEMSKKTKRSLSKETLINIKPRLRMTTLYRISKGFRIFSNWNWKFV